MRALSVPHSHSPFNTGPVRPEEGHCGWTELAWQCDKRNPDLKEKEQQDCRSTEDQPLAPHEPQRRSPLIPEALFLSSGPSAQESHSPSLQISGSYFLFEHSISKQSCFSVFRGEDNPFLGPKSAWDRFPFVRTGYLHFLTFDSLYFFIPFFSMQNKCHLFQFPSTLCRAIRAQPPKPGRTSAPTSTPLCSAHTASIPLAWRGTIMSTLLPFHCFRKAFSLFSYT